VDVAAVAQKVAFQWITAMAFLIVQLKTTFLTGEHKEKP